MRPQSRLAATDTLAASQQVEFTLKQAVLLDPPPGSLMRLALLRTDHKYSVNLSVAPRFPMPQFELVKASPWCSSPRTAMRMAMDFANRRYPPETVLERKMELIPVVMQH